MYPEKLGSVRELSMKIQTFAMLTALLLVAAPLAVAEEEGENEGPPGEATWGLCTAKEASQPGDEASNGTVSGTPPFQGISEEECENAERPGNGTGGPPEDLPGPEDHPDQDDNPGDEHQPENPGDGSEPDHPDEDDNAGSGQGDDQRP